MKNKKILIFIFAMSLILLHNSISYATNLIDNSITIIDYETNETTVMNVPQNNLSTNTTTGYIPSNFPPSVAPYAVFPPDGRLMVFNSRISPYSAVCKVEATDADDLSLHSGTGVLVGDNILLTAAHLVYNANGKFEEILAYPGFYNNNYPYGTAEVSRLILPTGWTENCDYTTTDEELATHDYDWAIVVLNTNIGNNSGWLSVKKYDNYLNLFNLNATIIGYPSTVNDGQTDVYGLYQYTSSGIIDTAYSKRIEYTIDTSSGESGAPILNSSNEVIGVHGGYRSSLSNDQIVGQTNRGVRIYNDMYDAIVYAQNTY